MTPGLAMTALVQTLATWAIGMVSAVFLALVLGVAVGASHAMRQLTASTIAFLRPIPSVALVPLAVLLHGTGREATLVLVVYAAFWPMLVQVIAGVQAVDPAAHTTARALRLGRASYLRTVVWPSALPSVMTGLRLAATVALVLTVTGELLIGTPGLGSAIELARASGRGATVAGLVVLTGLLGVAINLGVAALEHRMLHWHPSHGRTM